MPIIWQMNIKWTENKQISDRHFFFKWNDPRSQILRGPFFLDELLYVHYQTSNLVGSDYEWIYSETISEAYSLMNIHEKYTFFKYAHAKNINIKFLRSLFVKYSQQFLENGINCMEADFSVNWEGHRIGEVI